MRNAEVSIVIGCPIIIMRRVFTKIPNTFGLLNRTLKKWKLFLVVLWLFFFIRGFGINSNRLNSSMFQLFQIKKSNESNRKIVRSNRRASRELYVRTFMWNSHDHNDKVLESKQLGRLSQHNFLRLRALGNWSNQVLELGQTV